MKILLRTTIVLGLIGFSACKGTDGVITVGNCEECEEAVIRNYGDPVVDGCGYVVHIDSLIYMPKNLPSEYKVDDLKVVLNYQIQDSTRCGLGRFYKAIYIKEIRRKQ